MAVVDGRGIVCLAFCCGARATLAPKHKGGTTKDLIFVTTLQATIDFEKKIYHDPTRYLSSQFLGVINAQEGSFNVS